MILFNSDVIKYILGNKNKLDSKQEKEFVKKQLIDHKYKANIINIPLFSNIVFEEFMTIKHMSFTKINNNKIKYIIDDNYGICLRVCSYNHNTPFTNGQLAYDLRYYKQNTALSKCYIISMLNLENNTKFPNDDITNVWKNFIANQGFEFKYFSEMIMDVVDTVESFVVWSNEKPFSQTTYTTVKQIIDMYNTNAYYELSDNINCLMLLNVIKSFRNSFIKFVVNSSNKIYTSTLEYIRENLQGLIEYLTKMKNEYNKTSQKQQYYVNKMNFYNTNIVNNIYDINTIGIHMFLNKICLNNEYNTDANNLFNTPWNKTTTIDFDFTNLFKISLLLNSVNIVFNNHSQQQLVNIINKSIDNILLIVNTNETHTIKNKHNIHVVENI